MASPCIVPELHLVKKVLDIDTRYLDQTYSKLDCEQVPLLSLVTISIFVSCDRVRNNTESKNEPEGKGHERCIPCATPMYNIFLFFLNFCPAIECVTVEIPLVNKRDLLAVLFCLVYCAVLFYSIPFYSILFYSVCSWKYTNAYLMVCFSRSLLLDRDIFLLLLTSKTVTTAISK
jgi:hypothetical protein